MRALCLSLFVAVGVVFFAACESTGSDQSALQGSPQGAKASFPAPLPPPAPQASSPEPALEAARPMAAPAAELSVGVAGMSMNSRSGYRDQRVIAPPPAPPMPPQPPPSDTTFEGHGSNPRVLTSADPLSTFAVDVDTASFTIVRNYLKQGMAPPPEAVRVEEFVNYFPGRYRPPQEEDFAVYGEMAPSPFAQGAHLLKIGVKGREIPEENRKPLILTLVIDTSGSMEGPNRLGLVQRALGQLVGRLRPDDQVGIAIFNTVGQKIIDPTPISERWKLEEAVMSLRASGSTNAQQGLQIGYDMARRAYKKNSVNRVILFSDGVANTGVSTADGILSSVAKAAKDNIYLTAVGVGMGNTNDALLERLADKGNGHYAYIDDDAEARKFLAGEIGKGMEVIAQDAKIQVEFNPAAVASYRLLGYENRALRDQDFRRDKVDAGEINAGHSVTALYEIELAQGAESDQLAKVAIRYKSPGKGMAVKEIQGALRRSEIAKPFDQAGDHFKLAACAAAFAEVLRNSWWAQRFDVPRVRAEFDRAFPDVSTTPEVAELGDLLDAAGRLAIARPRPEPPNPNDQEPAAPYDSAAPIPMKKNG